MASNPAYAHTLRELDLPDLLTRADLVRATTASHGWQYLTEAIAEHEHRMTTRLLNETTKPEDIPYLRGLLAGLRSMREAAETIVAFAADREAEAKQEHAHAR